MENVRNGLSEGVFLLPGKPVSHSIEKRVMKKENDIYGKRFNCLIQYRLPA